ncbi:MAG: hypothetical protein AAF636_09885 [Pseudomonadota bacterium]
MFAQARTPTQAYEIAFLNTVEPQPSALYGLLMTSEFANLRDPSALPENFWALRICGIGELSEKVSRGWPESAGRAAIGPSWEMFNFLNQPIALPTTDCRKFDHRSYGSCANDTKSRQPSSLVFQPFMDTRKANSAGRATMKPVPTGLEKNNI